MDMRKRNGQNFLAFRFSSIKGTSNNYQFVTPAPYQVRDKLRPESSDIKGFWIPAFAGMTFLEVALRLKPDMQ
jgi:hypothetical protein